MLKIFWGSLTLAGSSTATMACVVTGAISVSAIISVRGVIVTIPIGISLRRIRHGGCQSIDLRDNGTSCSSLF